MSERHGKPTLANRTGRATASDSVMTPPDLAKRIIQCLQPTGLCLDPCRGQGAFYNAMPSRKYWCEITEGRDFFHWKKQVNWIITNPPYSIYDRFLQKCFDVSNNVALLVPLAKAFKSLQVERMVEQYGGLRLIWLIGSGTKCGFAFGFPTGVLWYQKGWLGSIDRMVSKDV